MWARATPGRPPLDTRPGMGPRRRRRSGKAVSRRRRASWPCLHRQTSSAAYPRDWRSRWPTGRCPAGPPRFPSTFPRTRRDCRRGGPRSRWPVLRGPPGGPSSATPCWRASALSQLAGNPAGGCVRPLQAQYAPRARAVAGARTARHLPPASSMRCCEKRGHRSGDLCQRPRPRSRLRPCPRGSGQSGPPPPRCCEDPSTVRGRPTASPTKRGPGGRRNGLLLAALQPVSATPPRSPPPPRAGGTPSATAPARAWWRQHCASPRRTPAAGAAAGHTRRGRWRRRATWWGS